jgi:hypothetical protein
MLGKVLVSSVFIVMLTACGDDGGTASGKWVGEVFANSNTSESTIVGEFGSYTECLEATQKEAKSGVFNCGVSTN